MKTIHRYALIGLLIAFAGCAVKRGEDRYDVETVTISVGTGNFLPGANITTVYKKQDPPAGD